MSQNYFKNFDTILYKFGDEDSRSVFQNIGQYVDLIDQVKTRDAFLTDYNILPNDRPDQVSYALYGKTDYYWTFYLMNDLLREQGWPVATQDVDRKAKELYPHETVRVAIRQPDVVDFDANNLPITRTKLIGTAPDIFPVGAIVTGSVSGTVGTIIKRDLSIGQLVIDTINTVTSTELTVNVNPNENGVIDLKLNLPQETFHSPVLWVITKDGVAVDKFDITISKLKNEVIIRNVSYTPNAVYQLTYYKNTSNLSDGTFVAGEEISYTNPFGATSAIVHGEMHQHLSTHHYEDASGQTIDIDAFTQNIPSGVQSVSYVERLHRQNDVLKSIKIIKPSAIQSVIKEFYELMNEQTTTV